MKKNTILCLIILTSLFQTIKAQEKQEWKTIFGNINLETHNHSRAYETLKEATGTIGHRLTGSANGCKKRIAEWRKAAETGHELGNHTLYHPCDGSVGGREWLHPENDLSKYTLKRITEEIRMTNVLLEAIDGKTKRTFAFTCGDMTAEGKPFMPELKADFVAARAVRPEMHTLDKVDLYNVDCYPVNGETSEKRKTALGAHLGLSLDIFSCSSSNPCSKLPPGRPPG